MHCLYEKLKRKFRVITRDKAVLIDHNHLHRDYALLFLRNTLVACAALFFVLSFFFSDIYHIFKGIGYFSGAAAYVFEILLLTNCFKTKIPLEESFMAYCLGPLYLLMGIGYIIK